MYRIRFAPRFKYNGDELSSCEKVYSNELNEIHLFLKQHNFDPNQSVIENVSEEEASKDSLESHTLHLFRLWSNQDKQEYPIYTTKHLMSLAIDYTANELANFSLFGATILRRDLQVINLVATYLGNLPCAEILDYLALDGDSLEQWDTSWMCIKKDLNQFLESENVDWNANDIWSIYEAIEAKSHPGEIEPITLEAYVQSFVSMLQPDTRVNPFLF